jgi:ribose transport system substrate-binding protein
MAQKAVEIGYDIMQGNTPAETTILIPADLITRENVEQYKGWTAE